MPNVLDILKESIEEEMDNVQTSEEGTEFIKEAAEELLADSKENDEVVETQSEEVPEQETLEDDTEGEQEIGDTPEEIETPQDDKAKKGHAFARLRKEKKEAEAKASDYEAKLEKIKDLFNAESVEQLVEHFEKEGYRLKSQETGKEVEELKSLMSKQEEIENIRKENERLKEEMTVYNAERILDSYSRKYNMTDDEFNQMIDNLDKASISIDDIVNSSNPDLLLKGASTDILLEKVKREKVDKAAKVISSREKEYGKTAKEPEERLTADSVADKLIDSINSFY